MNKITKIWFDEATGDMHEEGIDYYSIFNEAAGTRRTTMRLTREELLSRFWDQMPNTASRILGIDPVQPGSDRTVVFYTGQNVGKTVAMRLEPQYAVLSHRNYELMKEVADRDAWNRMRPRPPAATQKRAALHPLVRRLIDQLNKEN